MSVPVHSSAGATPDLRFTNVFSDTLWLYYAVIGEGIHQRTDQRLAFVPPAGSPAPSPPLGLAQTWKIAGGVYVFLGDRVSRGGLFVARLRVLLADPALAGARLLWVANPNDPFELWSVTALRLTALTDSGGELAALGLFGFRNYGLELAAGTALRVEEDPPAFRLGTGEGPPAKAWWTARDGALRLPLLTGPVRVPLTGAGARGLDFDMEIPPAGDDPEAVIDQLDVGCRFFYFFPGVRRAGLFTSQRYPIFDTTVSGLLLRATLDPLAPLDPERSRFAIDAARELPSFYRSNLGKPLTLASRSGSLLFAPKPGSTASGTRDAGRPPFYLVPAGAFTIAPAPGADAPGLVSQGPDLLCGVSGAEYVELEGVITFFPNQPAFAPYFDPRHREEQKASSGKRPLSSLATTSWAAVSDPDGGELSYYAQPEASILYGDADEEGFLGYFPLLAGLLPADPGRAASYPLVPYAGLDRGLASYSALESEALSPERRAVIYRLGRGNPDVMGRIRTAAGGVDPCTDPGAERALTPQGLVGVFDESRSVWQCLQLANNEDRLLAFQDVQGPLRAALLTNQQFLVISSPTSFAGYFRSNNQISIADWLFRLEPGLWSRHGTVVILKNHEKSLRQLAEDTSTWSLADEFNTFPELTQKRLLETFDTPADENFAHFRKLVDDPEWNGILFLNAFVPLSGLPPELRGLAAGIDPSLFYAHHLGINQTAVEGDGQKIEKSSLFGLIFYENPASRSAQPSGGAYDFHVERLIVRFANSEIAAFASRIGVTLNRLFGAAAEKQDSEIGNTVLLDGIYQRHGGETEARTPAYVFNLVRRARFELADAVITGVEITKAQFSTLTDEQEDEADETQARFSFWGHLGFAVLEGTGTEGREVEFDAFSFDRLAYSQLRLGMAFPVAVPAARSFAFDPGEMTFDGSESTAREGSLARRFPMKISGFVCSEGTERPTERGFMTLSVPISQRSVGRPWYGLVFDLNLGTVGALASKAGFVVQLATVWSPGSERYDTFIGLKLPGSSGAGNEISLQGILKVTLYSLELLVVEGAYLLKANGINLRFMSKTLPPGGSFDFFIFGDPNPSSGSDSLGWYGAYIKDKDKENDKVKGSAANLLGPRIGLTPLELTPEDARHLAGNRLGSDAHIDQKPQKGHKPQKGESQ